MSPREKKNSDSSARAERILLSPHGHVMLGRILLPPHGDLGGISPTSFIRKLFLEPASATAGFIPNNSSFLPDAEMVDDDWICLQHREMIVNILMYVVYTLRIRWSTFSVAVVLLDRYLDKKLVSISSLKLLCATCLCIAVKHTEGRHPLPADFIRAWNNEFSMKDVHELEVKLVFTLGFNLCARTVVCFVDYLSELSDPREKDVRETARFIAKAATLDARMSTIPPIIVALAAKHLALTAIPERSEGTSFARRLPTELIFLAGRVRVMNTAKMLLQFWIHFVDRTYGGIRMILVTGEHYIAGRIFTKESKSCLEKVYGIHVTTDGGFAKWASGFSLTQLLAAEK